MKESRSPAVGALGCPGKSDRGHRRWDGRQASGSEPSGAQKGSGPRLRVQDGRGRRRRACFRGLGYLKERSTEGGTDKKGISTRSCVECEMTQEKSATFSRLERHNLRGWSKPA